MNSMTREMKDSGIEWVGKIPVSWSIKKLNAFYSRKTIKNHPNERVLSVYREYGVIPKDSRSDNHNVTSENTSAYLLVQPTNLVVNKMKAWQGSMGISNHQGIVSPAYFVYQETAVPRERRFFHYLLRSNIYAQEFRRLSRGMREGQWDLTAYDFERTPIIVPPLLEQQQIATFLDIKCSQIDRLSDNIKQQIEELGEYKKALITQAITKGLDPDVEMKDSGIEWIGKIPSHWSILRIANIYTERSETGCKDDLPILMVSINSGVSNGEVLDEERTRMVVRSEDKSLYKRVYPDDLVYNTMRAWQGAFGAVRVNGLVSPAYVTAAPKIDIDSRYIEYLLRTPPAKEEMKRYSYGIADFRMRLYWQYFKNISVALPPLDEQHHIASFIDSSYFKIDSVIKKKSELLETLQDYKKSLIYDYVTGKREVPVSYRKGGSHE